MQNDGSKRNDLQINCCRAKEIVTSTPDLDLTKQSGDNIHRRRDSMSEEKDKTVNGASSAAKIISFEPDDSGNPVNWSPVSISHSITAHI